MSSCEMCCTRSEQELCRKSTCLVRVRVLHPAEHRAEPDLEVPEAPRQARRPPGRHADVARVVEQIHVVVVLRGRVACLPTAGLPPHLRVQPLLSLELLLELAQPHVQLVDGLPQVPVAGGRRWCRWIAGGRGVVRCCDRFPHGCDPSAALHLAQFHHRQGGDPSKEEDQGNFAALEHPRGILDARGLMLYAHFSTCRRFQSVRNRYCEMQNVPSSA